MTDGEALRRAIIADPDDDTARLVYADWLDEDGDPERAAFIRAQIDAVRGEPFSMPARKAAKRADELLEIYRAKWTQHLRGAYTEWPRFERGFVSHMAVEPVAFVPRADAIFDAEPIQSLKLNRFAGTGGPVSFQPLFELPRLRQLRRLELSSRLGLAEEEYGQLSGCQYLTGLRDLSLRDNPVPPAWLSAVLTGNVFPELTGLELGEIPHLGRCLSESLPKANHRELRRLDVSGMVFMPSEQLHRVLTSRCLRRVEELRLVTTGIAGQEGPLFHLGLGFVIPWTNLVVLDLRGQWVGDGGVEQITIHKEALALRWLGLANNGLRSDAVRYLVNAKHLALNYLDVSGNNLSLSDIAILQRRFPGAMIVS